MRHGEIQRYPNIANQPLASRLSMSQASLMVSTPKASRSPSTKLKIKNRVPTFRVGSSTLARKKGFGSSSEYSSSQDRPMKICAATVRLPDVF